MTRKGNSFRQLSFLATTITISSFIMQHARAMDVVFKSGEPQYQASYSVDTTNPDLPELHIQLELLNYDVTNWFQYNQTTPAEVPEGDNSTEGGDIIPVNTDPLPGVLMGVGIGKQLFGDSDLIVCNFTQDMNMTRNSFDCFDYRVDENGTVILDEQQDVRAVFTVYPFANRTITTNIETTNPDTNEVTTTTVNTIKADFVVSFVRSLTTTDTTDFQLDRNAVDAYWVYGDISGNELNITQHLENASHFGSTQLDLSPQTVLESGNNNNNDNGNHNPGSNAIALMSQSLALIVAFALFIFQ